MKKFVLMMASALFAVSASAQTVQESKTFDNFYVGINGGLSTKTTGHKWLSGLNPNASLQLKGMGPRACPQAAHGCHL